MKLMNIVVVGDLPNPYNHLFNKYSSRGSHKPAIVLHLGDKGGSKIENISFHGELQDNISYVGGCSRGRCNREEEEQMIQTSAGPNMDRALQKHNLSRLFVRCL